MSVPASSVAISKQANFVEVAVESLRSQSQALNRIAERLGGEFDRVIELILACQGRAIFSGVGKSGLVGKKISGTLASTGTPSFFMHPTEAFHGDLGMIKPEDLIILISYSGETEEVIKLIPSLKDFGNPLVCIVGRGDSTLAKHSDVVLNVAVEREICPHNLAPTTSTLATMAMGDAMAVALIKARNFKPMDFAKLHPGGSLGRRLLTRVRDVMRKDNLPFVTPETTVRECLFKMTAGRLGLVLVVEDGLLKGIFTDGDLRRAMMQDPNTMDKTVSEYMTHDPFTISANTLLVDAEAMMLKNKIRVLVVLGERHQAGRVDDICGILEIFD